MSTNYYAKANHCKNCGRTDAKLHIGKSAAGWRFLFHVTDEIKNYKDWVEYLKQDNVQIFDEYNKICPLKDFMDLIEKKQNNSYPKSYAPEFTGDKRYLDEEGYFMLRGEFL